MCDHVPAQVAGVVEAGGALTAGVRLLPGVRSQVDLQAAVLREALPALRAGVRLLPGVNAHVDAQRGLVDERLAAKRAEGGRLPRVTRPVRDQVLAAEEALAAEAAVQGLEDAVGEGVLLLVELADVTRLPRLTVVFFCFHCRVHNGRSHPGGLIPLRLAVPVVRHPSRRVSAGGEVHEAVVGDVVVRGQGGESLEFGGGEEGVALVLEELLPSSANTEDSQLLVLSRPSPCRKTTEVVMA